MQYRQEEWTLTHVICSNNRTRPSSRNAMSSMFIPFRDPEGYTIICEENETVQLITTTSSRFIPIFLGGVMQACGNTPPIKIKSTAY